MIPSTYYPTPDIIISKMLRKAFAGDREISSILEPSAGQGHIAERAKEYGRTSYGGEKHTVSCVEIDPNFQSILRGKGLNVIDSDFLAYAGTDRFDLIIANPPFDDGAEHLMKAIDIMYSGRIVFLLNAETIKNPFSNTRKLLVRRLEELGADVEYIKDAFLSAQRKTAVEIALVVIDITREIEQDLFAGCDDSAQNHETRIDADKDLVSGNSITSRVEMFNAALHSGLQTIEGYYRNYSKVGQFIRLEVGEAERWRRDTDRPLTMLVNEDINKFSATLRKHHWKSVLDLDEVHKRMTQKKIDEFNHLIEEYSFMDFTEHNVRQFIIGLLGSYEDTMTEAVADVFDLMTTKHSWHEETSKNIHYFNGWVTNKAFYCNKKVVLPVYGSCGHPFIGWSGEWRLSDHEVERKLGDIDKVMNYFDAGPEYVSICKALTDGFAKGLSRGIESTYFKIDVFKKRTVHLTFRSEDIRRRFNVTACRHKKWLPHDYGKKKYSEMSEKEKNIVEAFEGKAAYSQHVGEIEFARKDTLALPA